MSRASAFSARLQARAASANAPASPQRPNSAPQNVTSPTRERSPAPVYNPPAPPPSTPTNGPPPGLTAPTPAAGGVSWSGDSIIRSNISSPNGYGTIGAGRPSTSSLDAIGRSSREMGVGTEDYFGSGRNLKGDESGYIDEDQEFSPTTLLIPKDPYMAYEVFLLANSASTVEVIKAYERVVAAISSTPEELPRIRGAMYSICATRLEALEDDAARKNSPLQKILLFLTQNEIKVYLETLSHSSTFASYEPINLELILEDRIEREKEKSFKAECRVQKISKEFDSQNSEVVQLRNKVIDLELQLDKTLGSKSTILAQELDRVKAENVEKVAELTKMKMVISKIAANQSANKGDDVAKAVQAAKDTLEQEFNETMEETQKLTKRLETENAKLHSQKQETTLTLERNQRQLDDLCLKVEKATLSIDKFQGALVESDNKLKLAVNEHDRQTSAIELAYSKKIKMLEENHAKERIQFEGIKLNLQTQLVTATSAAAATAPPPQIRTPSPPSSVVALNNSNSNGNEVMNSAKDAQTKLVIGRLAKTIKHLQSELTSKNIENADLMMKLINGEGNGNGEE